MRLIFFYLMTVLGIIACRNKSADSGDQKMLDCYIRILEQEENVLAQATMKSVSTKNGVSASSPVEIEGGIRYQGSPMSVMPTAGLMYVREFPGKYMSEHVFTWDDPEKGRMTFTVPVNNLPEFSFGSPKVSASKPAALTWNGKGLERGEALTLIWENAKDNLTVPMELYVQGNFPRIDFPAAKMKDLSPGQWTLYIVRKKLLKTEVSGVSCQAVAEFYSKTIPIEVEK